ncbi:LysR family transcriptional regulator [Nakamurella sp. YIM 132087]|uniref:LysR family transcriptional regulator n=1 Tax=Nakamurella alba TaxID=2665158 RepID=A0A7K1FMI0_9ACTN|nr:LysR family transcriptional regulator [Nakamurella alba]MTD15362.1 LysR family transcriptional regulator [Nakamurella alba]
MELRHLKYFVAVAEERNFTRAGERLHIVQSAVSAAVKGLERELGAELLDRGSRRVRLTDAGEALLPQARLTLAAARDARDAVAQVRGGLRGTLRVGTLTSVSGLLDLPAALGEYHRRHPGVVLRTSAAPTGSQGLVDALIAHRLDVTVVSLPGPAPAGITVVDLASAPIDLAVPAEHRLADRDTVTLADLDDADFIDSPIGYGNRAVVDRAFATAGLRRRVTIEIPDIATGVEYVRHGLGIALLPRFVLPRFTQPGSGVDAGVRTIRVTGAELDWPLSVAVPADRAPGAAVTALLELIGDFVRS